jgi:hypothetical protein
MKRYEYTPAALVNEIYGLANTGRRLVIVHWGAYLDKIVRNNRELLQEAMSRKDSSSSSLIQCMHLSYNQIKYNAYQ